MNTNSKVKRYAFIDVQNMATTTEKLLGFLIDWEKLYRYLREKWNCEKVFFYSGVEKSDHETLAELELLSQSGCIVIAKTFSTYRKPDKKIIVECASCGTMNVKSLKMGYNKKSNCDVNLTVDCMEEAGDGKEFFIFTGDGDFEYLIRRVVKKGTKVYVVSSNATLRNRNMKTRRLSTKLKELVSEYHGRVNLVEINSWKLKIEKDL